MKTTNKAAPSPAALTTLRYWAPGPFASSLASPEDHLDAGYGGWGECFDAGWLRAVGPDGKGKVTDRGFAVMCAAGYDAAGEAR
jgi:hypothetical protein